MEENEQLYAIMNRIFIGSDRIGFHLKDEIFIHLISRGYNVVDIGPFEEKSVHYPEIAFEVSRFVSDSLDSFGILICSTGIGMSIAANKISKIRAANCTSIFMAEHARLHNDANVLCLGSSVVETDLTLMMIDKFLRTPFEGGKHIERIQMLNDIS